jgi:putative membrane-bound dehydrogenase-like protein
MFRPLCAMILALSFFAGIALGAEGPRTPADSMKAFVLADPDLTIELVASEPDVTSPVAIAWDEDGRLYVAEMNDYPVAPASGRIRQLEDRDCDGRYERATIFADGLPFPSGVMPCFGGVLVTAAPNIWYFRDKDGDGRADEKILMLSGFGEGNTQLRVNGLYLGIDNLIYAANGRSDGDVRSKDDRPGFPVSIRRRDLRLLALAFPTPDADWVPRAVRAEAIAGYSQFGLAHDDWGNRFPSWNTIPIRHVVLEQQSLDRNPYLAETSSIASILDTADGGRIFGISPAQARFNRESVAYFNASCGPIVYRGDLLPAKYQGNAFVCEPLTNLVHRRVLEPAGVTFIARRVEAGREFLASSDPAFRPVNLATGPDGALYVVDMYRELVEHPQFVPESARTSVDFRRWHDRGRIWRIRPKATKELRSQQPEMSKVGIAELVNSLKHTNGWWRSTAQRVIGERWMKALQARRAEPALPQALIDVLKDKSNPVARLHALWALAAVERVDEALLSEIASDPHPGLREHALRVAADRLEHHVPPKQLLSTSILIKLADDAAIRVRLQAALALGDRCRIETTALDALVKIAARDADDPWMRLAILSGLANSALNFLLICDAIPSVSGLAELKSQAAAIVGVRRQTSEQIVLLEMIGARWREKAARDEIRLKLTDCLTMIKGLAEGLERSGPPLSSLVLAPPADLKPGLDRIDSIWPAASTLALSDNPGRERLIAIEVLARGRPDLAETVVPTLLLPTQPVEIQLGAARAVATSRRLSLASKALADWSKLSVGARRELLAGLISNPSLAPALIDALEKQLIVPGELDAPVRTILEHLPDPEERERASKILARFAPAQRSDALARYQAALKLTGDPKRGTSVFAKNCQTCHQHQGQGHRAGPDLSGIAGRAPEALLSDIVDPNKEVAPDFATLSVATRRGQTFAGLLAEETATTLKLRRAEGVEDTLLRSEIDELRSTGKSLMPEGLEQNINLQEMADLIAFLREGR